MGTKIRGPLGRHPQHPAGVDSGTKQKTLNQPPASAGKKPINVPLYSMPVKEFAKDPDKGMALESIAWFRQRSEKKAFTQMDRKTVADELEDRIENPFLIKQRNSGLCGPAAFLFIMASRRPHEYVQLVIDLFEHGKAKTGSFWIRPSEDCRNSRPKPKRAAARVISSADWIPMVSLRDSMNMFLDVDQTLIDAPWWTLGLPNLFPNLSFMSMPGSLVAWFEGAGFSKVESSLAWTYPDEHLKEANSHYKKGGVICLLVDPELFKGNEKKDVFTSLSLQRHWVVLTKKITFSIVDGDDCAEIIVFSWGKHTSKGNDRNCVVPLKLLKNWYFGYVRAED